LQILLGSLDFLIILK